MASFDANGVAEKEKEKPAARSCRSAKHHRTLDAVFLEGAARWKKEERLVQILCATNFICGRWWMVLFEGCEKYGRNLRNI